MYVAICKSGWGSVHVYDRYKFGNGSVTVNIVANCSMAYVTKSTLERVSNPVYCCINGVFHELRHDSVMNIILKPRLSS